MFFVNHDGSIDPNIELKKGMDMSRVYVYLFGASQHPDALPCTAVSIHIPTKGDLIIRTGKDARILNSVYDQCY